MKTFTKHMNPMCLLSSMLSGLPNCRRINNLNSLFADNTAATVQSKTRTSLVMRTKKQNTCRTLIEIDHTMHPHSPKPFPQFNHQASSSGYLVISVTPQHNRVDQAATETTQFPKILDPTLAPLYKLIVVKLSDTHNQH